MRYQNNTLKSISKLLVKMFTMTKIVTPFKQKNVKHKHLKVCSMLIYAEDVLAKFDTLSFKSRKIYPYITLHIRLRIPTKIKMNEVSSAPLNCTML